MPNNPSQNDPKKSQQGGQSDPKKSQKSPDDDNQRDQNRDKKQGGNY